MSIKKLLPMSALTIAVAATFSVPVYAEDFIDDGTHIIDLAIALPKATPAVKATHHSFIYEGQGENVKYFQTDHSLQNGDSIYLEKYGSRFCLDNGLVDLTLSSVTVTDAQSQAGRTLVGLGSLLVKVKVLKIKISPLTKLTLGKIQHFNYMGT